MLTPPLLAPFVLLECVNGGAAGGGWEARGGDEPPFGGDLHLCGVCGDAQEVECERLSTFKIYVPTNQSTQLTHTHPSTPKHINKHTCIRLLNSTRPKTLSPRPFFIAAAAGNATGSAFPFDCAATAAAVAAAVAPTVARESVYGFGCCFVEWVDVQIDKMDDVYFI